MSYTNIAGLKSILGIGVGYASPLLNQPLYPILPEFPAAIASYLVLSSCNLPSEPPSLFSP